MNRRSVRATAIVVLPAAVLAVGLFVGHLQSTEWRWGRSMAAELTDLTELDPVRALPRTATALATLDARRHLESGRPYAAWETLRPHLDSGGATGDLANLLAARAAAEWGGWDRVRSVLADREWLADVSAGEGLYLLARAEEELGDLAAAESAYRAYLSVEGAAERSVARARHASVLSRLGDHAGAARAFEAAAGELPGIADWLGLRRLESLYAAGDPSAARVALRLTGGGGSPPVRARLALLESAGLADAGNPGRAIYRLEWESRILRAADAPDEAARLDLERARLLAETGNEHRAREVLREVATAAEAGPAERVAAAERLGGLDAPTVLEHLARADAYEAASRPGDAADALLAALEAGLVESGALRLRLATQLFDARKYDEARPEYRRAAELLTGAEDRARAELFAARALFRSAGGRSAAATRRSALAEFERVAERYPGTAAAGTALFLLGDEASTTGAGLAYYRRAAEVAHSPDAAESLYRVGDRSLRLDDRAGAIAAWEEYVSRYPKGDQTAHVAYEVAKLHEAAGRSDRADVMYSAAIAAEPTSYWAFRAGEHLDESPLRGILAEPRPWPGLASEPAEVADALRRLDLLAEVGLTDAREREYRSTLRAFERRPLSTLLLAEGLSERGEVVEALRLARGLVAQRDGEWDDRLLRIVYPFPFRELITAEAERAGIDPMLYAGLVRQESTFRPRIRSRVGATGLGQIMPATGQWLARTLGIRDYDDSLLEVPEVNLRMGMRYFGDLLIRYDGAADLALAGYNAGPSRADRWRRRFGYGRDTDAFRAAIPFDETRNYVMIVLRNASIYEDLYGARAVEAR